VNKNDLLRQLHLTAQMAALAQRLEAALDEQLSKFGKVVETQLSDGANSWTITVREAAYSIDTMKAYVATLNAHSKRKYTATYAREYRSVPKYGAYGEEDGTESVAYNVMKLALA
jgi:hypothetical protein